MSLRIGPSPIGCRTAYAASGRPGGLHLDLPTTTSVRRCRAPRGCRLQLLRLQPRLQTRRLRITPFLKRQPALIRSCLCRRDRLLPRIGSFFHVSPCKWHCSRLCVHVCAMTGSGSRWSRATWVISSQSVAYVDLLSILPSGSTNPKLATSRESSRYLAPRLSLHRRWQRRANLAAIWRLVCRSIGDSLAPMSRIQEMGEFFYIPPVRFRDSRGRK